MRRELITKTRSLGGSSDLTLLAPIRTGLVPSLESVTYKTRTKRLLASLNAGRTSSHEYALLRPFSDAVDRVGKIHSVRVAIVEPDRILLSVTFDGGQESYLRVLWQKVGTLLDLIFCNAEGYVTAHDSSFEAWADWVRGVQIETDFFYGLPGHTVDDVQYLRNEELAHRQIPGGTPDDLVAARQTTRSAEELAWSLHRPTPLPHVIKELGRQGLRALAHLYRLTAYYVPGTAVGKGDGVVLHRAARELLQEFLRLHKRHLLDSVIKEGRKRFDEQIDWLLEGVPPRKVPKLPAETPMPTPVGDVQAGIISAPPGKPSHGCLLLIAFHDRPAAEKFLHMLLTDKWISREGVAPAAGRPFASIAFTHEGLRALGLSETRLADFPQEFREGMEARASVLGDLRTNHPRRWRLPKRNFPAASTTLVELSTVHAVLQLRTAEGPGSFDETLDKKDPLFNIVAGLFQKDAGVELLSVQPMVIHVNENGTIKEHFGFADGKSQPVLDPEQNGKVYDRNQVQLGEFLLGYANEAEEAKAEVRNNVLLNNGSFLVVRKLSQKVEAFEKAMDAAAATTGLSKELILAKLVGRWRDGRPVIDEKTENDFDYSSEHPPGSLCPFHSHIRRCNPRQLDDPDLPPPPGHRTPRLMRRGMAYGPLYAERPKDQRGLIFMAYNASIAEQFEVVQRWISGGNSTGGFSGHGDPLLGVAPIGQRRYFRFEHERKVYRIELDGTDKPLGDPQPFVRLEWGMYLFTPSIKALAELARTAGEQAGKSDEQVWSPDRGKTRIEELKSAASEERWKTALEDPEEQRLFRSADIWAAIRRHYKGVLHTQTPYGVLVAGRQQVQEVLDNEQGLYSVRGADDAVDSYHARMNKSIGEIFLGLDDTGKDDTGKDCKYRELSLKVNEAIGKLTKPGAFDIARQAATKWIEDQAANEKALAAEFGEPRWEFNLDVKEVVDKVLEKLCQEWFGLPKEKCKEIQPGGTRWDWDEKQPVLYPGHFTAPSRYIFQPLPAPSVKVESEGQRYGRALQKAFGALVRRHRDRPAGAKPVIDTERPIAKTIFEAFPARADDDLVARTMVGGMMGFLPTMDGNLRLSLNEWLRDGSFWSLRNALAKCEPVTIDDPEKRAVEELKNAETIRLEPALKRAMQLRPSPELIWRTAMRDGKIGEESFKQGEKIVLSLVSATQQCLENRAQPDLDVYPIFGGKRSAPPTPHPTHACPGYEAAMGGLLGILYALLDVKEAMRPSSVPLALTLEGDLPRPADALPAMEPGVKVLPFSARAAKWAAGRLVSTSEWLLKTFASTRSAGGLLLADGDSWMSYSPYGPLSEPRNIAAYLARKHGYEVENLASMGTRLYDYYEDDDEKWQDKRKPAKDSEKLGRLLTTVKRMIARGRPPAAILLSAAGNDVVEDRLLRLLNHNTPADPLNKLKVDEMVDELMRLWLTHVLTRLKAECGPIPVFIHGYDFPVPDCRWIAGIVSRRAWLFPNFEQTKYEAQTWRHYPDVGTGIMNTLITRLNKMQGEVAAQAEFKAHVVHVNLTGLLDSSGASAGATRKYELDWDNELHPSESGFTKVTQKFADELAKRGIKRS